MSLLAPRIVLGLWHTHQVSAARSHLPYLAKWLISSSALQAIRYWHCVDGISVRYTALHTLPFLHMLVLQRARAMKKRVIVWDVKTTREMRQCALWRVDGVMTDYMQVYDQLRTQARNSSLSTLDHSIRADTWRQWAAYSSNQVIVEAFGRFKLWRIAGCMRQIVR